MLSRSRVKRGGGIGGAWVKSVYVCSIRHRFLAPAGLGMTYCECSRVISADGFPGLLCGTPRSRYGDRSRSDSNAGNKRLPPLGVRYRRSPKILCRGAPSPGRRWPIGFQVPGNLCIRWISIQRRILSGGIPAVPGRAGNPHSRTCTLSRIVCAWVRRG
jgi:hypothetical protein